MRSSLSSTAAAGMDARALGVMGMAATLAGIGGHRAQGLLRFANPYPAALVVTGVLAVSLAGALWCALWALKPDKGWRHDRDLDVFARHLGDYDDTQVMEWAGEFTTAAVRANSPVLVAKGRRVIASVRFLAAAPALLTVLAVLVNL